MKILTIANQKGGTGKTTSAVIFAQAAAHKGYKVLAIDLDPQANLSFIFAANYGKDKTSLQLLEGTPAAELIQHTSCGVDIIPASWNLQTVKTSKGSARRLQKALQPLKDKYDYVIIDTPPTASELQYNALQAAHTLINLIVFLLCFPFTIL